MIVARKKDAVVQGKAPLTKNVVQLRAGFVNLPESKEPDGRQRAASVAAELLQLGFSLDQRALVVLSNASKGDVESFYSEVVPYLREVTGSTRSFRPFWKGFPEQVMSMSETELWFHQLVHYASNGAYDPSDWTKSRPAAFERGSYTRVTAGTEEDLDRVFTDLASVNQSLGPEELLTLGWFVASGRALVMPAVVPFRENLAVLAALGAPVVLRDPTDVLRVAAVMSGWSASLPALPSPKQGRGWGVTKVDRNSMRFGRFSRAVRRRIMDLLEGTSCDPADMATRSGRWKRLGEVVHPGEFRRTHPRAFAAFESVRDGRARSWYSELDACMRSSLTAGLAKMAERPGELMRRIDRLFRSHPGSVDEVISAVAQAAPRASNKVLFEVYAHMERRRLPVTGRTAMIKGGRSRTPIPDLPALPGAAVDAVQDVVLGAVRGKLAALPALGACSVDLDLFKYPLPTNMRSVNPAMRPAPRGTRTPMTPNGAGTVRAFVHWMDDHGSQDIDLTATFVPDGKDGGKAKPTLVGWNGVHSSAFAAYSGDVRHRWGACAEYIDVNLSAALAAGYRYVVLDARNFNGGSMASVPECAFGCMERERPLAGEVFRPDTLANAVRLQSEASSVLVSLLDLREREYIMLDLDQSGIPVATENYGETLQAISAYTEAPRVSLGHLVTWHVESRGTLLSSGGRVIGPSDFPSYVDVMKWMGI